MTMFDELEDYLSSGDPVMREWFLVKSNFWPFFLCAAYLLTVKVIGPAIMRDREPFDLRKTMIVYNMFLVTMYSISLSIVVYHIQYLESSQMCKNTFVTKENVTYRMAICGWVVYMLKYVEFLDTIFFVLRKKDKLITNLHVIHHATLPMMIWILMRTERSGFQIYPGIINSMIHIVMYSYYGLAAVGPRVRKYLWWKRYLTIAQMIQFLLVILLFTVVMPLAGCTVSKASMYINFFAATFFFILFYNFYRKSFQPAKAPTNVTTNGESKVPVANGTHVEEKAKCN